MENNEEKKLSGEIIDIEASELESVTEDDFKDYMNPMSVFDELNITDKTAFLWHYNPVPENEPEPFPEYSFSEDDFDGGRITAARVRGKKHKHDGTNCDDWYEYDVSGDWKIMIVSDGAGSKKFSRIGARAACTAAVSFLKEKLAEAPDEIKQKLSLPLSDTEFMNSCGFFASLLQDSVTAARDAVASAFEERKSKYEYLSLVSRDLELKDFSSTFLACIVLPVTVEGNTEYFAASIQIGDGIICSVDAGEESDKALRLLSTPDSGAYSGETDFITSDNQLRRETLMSKTKIMRGKSSAFMLMTDGVADDYFPNSPELLRLYLDLCLNGVTDIDDSSSEGEIPEIIPDPVSHPWVNDNDIKFSVQYASRLEERIGSDLETLWKNTAFVNKASLKNFDESLPEKRSERLSRWLDNYTERGSFDDRTLVICEMIQECADNNG